MLAARTHGSPQGLPLPRNQGPLQVGFTEVAQKPPKKKAGGKNSKYFCINEAGQTQWLTDYDGDNMVEFIKRHKNNPFILYWSPEAVHSSNQEAPPSLTKRTRAKGKRSKLAGAIVSVDDQVGKLLKALQQHGLRVPRRLPVPSQELLLYNII